jgi:HPt (histidine-containing phosphotransfer) domain-containing protein
VQVLDLEQLRNATMEDPDLMRELVAALIEDTVSQIAPLQAAIHRADGLGTVRMAHYSKGACANIGAESTAAVLQRIEQTAESGDFDGCSASLVHLGAELDRLRSEAAGLLEK